MKVFVAIAKWRDRESKQITKHRLLGVFSSSAQAQERIIKFNLSGEELDNEQETCSSNIYITELDSFDNRIMF